MSAPGWHGVPQRFVRRDGAVGDALEALAERPVLLDVDGVMSAWGKRPWSGATIVQGVTYAPGAVPPLSSGGDWQHAFERAVARIARQAVKPVLALGGGVDGAAVLAAWKKTDVALPALATFSLGDREYDELEPAERIAAWAGARLRIIRVNPDRLLGLTPHAVAACGAPLYNLHPVSRYALALELAALGYETLITGDGADAAFRGRPDLDYVPLVAAMTARCGLGLHSPFLAEDVVAASLALAPDPSKRAVRQYLVREGFPRDLGEQPKRPRRMPALDLTLDSAAIRSLANELRLDVTLATDSDRVAWFTLSSLVSFLRGGV
jgi:asparagine synthetase B (glutamine-hydrolysing)